MNSIFYFIQTHAINHNAILSDLAPFISLSILLLVCLLQAKITVKNNVSEPEKTIEQEPEQKKQPIVKNQDRSTAKKPRHTEHGEKRMSTKEIRTAAMNDLKKWIDTTIHDIETEPGDTLAAFIEMKQAKTDLQVRNATYDFIYYNTEERENSSLFYGDFQFELSVCQAVDLLPKIKANFVECPKNKVVEKRNAFDKTRSINDQKYIERLRNEFNGVGISEEHKEAYKNRVLKAYSKANNNYLIKLCWKYITNPQKIEGVNIPYEVEPEVIFTPYRDCVNLPEFIKCKIAV